MSAPESRTRLESFSAGIGQGYTLVKSVPIKPPLIACTPTYAVMQPAGLCGVGDTPLKVLTLIRNGVRQTLSINAANAMQSQDALELLALFQNATKQGQAFITLQDFAPVFDEVTPQLMVEGGNYVEAPMMGLYEEDIGTLMSGIGSDGAVVTSNNVTNVLGESFHFMAGVDGDPGPGVSLGFEMHQMESITEDDLVIEETVLTFERTPGVNPIDDFFNGLFSSDAASPVTLRSCAYIKFPIKCIPSYFEYDYVNFGLDALNQAIQTNEMQNALVGCLITFGGYSVISLVPLRNVNLFNKYSGWANTTPITFHEGNVDIINSMLSFEYGIEVDTAQLGDWTSAAGSNELRRIAMVRNELIDDRLGWTVKGFDVNDTNLMYDQIMNSTEDFVSFTKRSTEITISKLPGQVLNIINPDNYTDLGYVDYVDIFNSGDDITVHSCNRMDASDYAMEVLAMVQEPNNNV